MIMGKCLITKLNGSVQNDSLLRIGEFCIKVSKVESPTADTQRFVVNNSKDAQLRIIGDGYFTNETLSENKGKALNITANTETTVYFSNGDFEIVVSEKYSLTQVGTYIRTSWKESKSKLSFDINLLKYSPNISFLAINGTKVTGDIAVLGKLTGLTHLTLADTQVTGDIAVFGKLTGLTYLSFNTTKLTGDIAVFGKLTGLTKIPIINRTGVTGDIAVYKNCNFKTLQLLGTSVYGDLSVLPNNILWVQADINTTGTFTWTGIKNRTNILAVENCKCNKIDAFLNDMATLEAKFGGEQIWYKTISLIGTRTSASDAAVATLQSKGYTVSINPS
nr:MAG TPA: hypothetical protein [Crassvirales sp.]